VATVVLVKTSAVAIASVWRESERVDARGK
jgi:hypothetical protein